MRRWAKFCALGFFILFGLQALIFTSLFLTCETFQLFEELCRGMGSQEPGFLFGFMLMIAFFVFPFTMFLGLMSVVLLVTSLIVNYFKQAKE